MCCRHCPHDLRAKAKAISLKACSTYQSAVNKSYVYLLCIWAHTMNKCGIPRQPAAVYTPCIPWGNAMDAPLLYGSAVYYCSLINVTCILVSAIVAVLAVVAGVHVVLSSCSGCSTCNTRSSCSSCSSCSGCSGCSSCMLNS